MDFGSEYVYRYDEKDYEYISDEEFEEGMDLSDSGSDSDSGEEVLPRAVGGAGPAKSARKDGTATDMMGMPDAPPPPTRPPPPGLPVAPAAPPRVLKTKAKHHWRSAPAQRSQAQQPRPVEGGRRVRKGDTNIVSIKFNKLIAPSNMHAGDPTYCSSCAAILSKLSKTRMEGEDKVWQCEFCGQRNVVDVEDEEIPQEEDVTFMLEPALSTTASGPSGLDESLVVFCVDISGSMCVTTEVPGHIELRGAESLRRARSLNTDRSDQYLPRQRRDVTYVSRLQSVQAAIDHQLAEMNKEFPNRRVALVTFSSEVTIVGDGSTDPVSVAGDKLTNKDSLITIATEQPLASPIKSSRNALGEKLFQLEEGGPTALGPALQIATTMAAKTPGSKVILCTDGMANVGMGKLDNFKSHEEEEESLQFYKDVGSYAVEKGVSVSVITIKGTDCKLVHIGKLADQTGGQVNIVDPLKLTQEFSTILANKIIATNVVATFIIHKELYFFYEETEESKVVKNVGNATADSEISFEYGVRTKDKKEKGKAEEKASGSGQGVAMETGGGPDGVAMAAGGSGKVQMDASSDMSQLTELPFQLQITYTDTEGAKALRLLTKSKPVTRDRKVAEQKCNLDVLGRHTSHISARLALDGEYTMARESALVNQRVAWRYTNSSEEARTRHRPVYKKMFGKVKSVENKLNFAQKKERATRGHTYSDEEDEMEECEAIPEERSSLPTALMASSASGKAPAKPKKSFFSKLKKKDRYDDMDDEQAADLYEAL